jgi:hypothetical protein
MFAENVGLFHTPSLRLNASSPSSKVNCFCFSAPCTERNQLVGVFSTGDESWFFHYTPHQKLWMPPDVDAPGVSRRLIATPKLMFTIFWGISGIHVTDSRPPSRSFESASFIDHILNGFQTLPVLLREKK